MAGFLARATQHAKNGRQTAGFPAHATQHPTTSRQTAGFPAHATKHPQDQAPGRLLACTRNETRLGSRGTSDAIGRTASGVEG